MNARSATLLGRGVEVALSLVAVALAAAACRRFGAGRDEVAWLLVAGSPLVGEFAATMVYRYVPGMSLADAGLRFFRPSQCDACGRALSQWDILPVLPYVVRRGRCSCRAFAVPATCTAAGLLTFLGAAALMTACRYLDMDALAPLALFLSFVPAVAADLAVGEVDEWLFVGPVVVSLFFVQDPPWMGPAMALMLAANLWLSALSARFFGGTGVLSIGSVDLLAVGITGLFMTMQDAVSASVWFVVMMAVSHVLVRLPVARRLKPVSAYGPIRDDGSTVDALLAVPALPSAVAAGVLGLVWHFA